MQTEELKHYTSFLDFQLPEPCPSRLIPKMLDTDPRFCCSLCEPPLRTPPYIQANPMNWHWTAVLFTCSQWLRRENRLERRLLPTLKMPGNKDRSSTNDTSISDRNEMVKNDSQLRLPANMPLFSTLCARMPAWEAWWVLMGRGRLSLLEPGVLYPVYAVHWLPRWCQSWSCIKVSSNILGKAQPTVDQWSS